ncbi:unnamed protein product [Calypogeia fissa]
MKINRSSSSFFLTRFARPCPGLQGRESGTHSGSGGGTGSFSRVGTGPTVHRRQRAASSRWEAGSLTGVSEIQYLGTAAGRADRAGQGRAGAAAWYNTAADEQQQQQQLLQAGRAGHSGTRADTLAGSIMNPASRFRQDRIFGVDRQRISASPIFRVWRRCGEDDRKNKKKRREIGGLEFCGAQGERTLMRSRRFGKGEVEEEEGVGEGSRKVFGSRTSVIRSVCFA